MWTRFRVPVQNVESDQGGTPWSDKALNVAKQIMPNIMKPIIPTSHESKHDKKLFSRTKHAGSSVKVGFLG